MPLIKIGKAYYNDEERPIYLLQGNATKDAEWAPVNDKPHAKVSVAAQESLDGGTLFVNVNGWRAQADQVAKITKRDSILAIGVLRKREYNDKFYYDLDADFVALSGAGLTDRSGYTAQSSSSAPTQPATTGGFTDLGDVDDGDLPF